MSEYLKRRQMIKLGIAQPAGPKEPKPLKAVSDKKAAQMKEAAKEKSKEDTVLEKWFKARRKELVGVCQCGCARKSSKMDDDNFRSSIAHIFPKAIFKSVATHPLNYVERNFWDGCHTNMDQQGLDKWVNMADWEDIREKFFELEQNLTEEERATNFYTHLSALVRNS